MGGEDDRDSILGMKPFGPINLWKVHKWVKDEDGNPVLITTLEGGAWTGTTTDQ